MNRQRFLAELRRLLVYMTEEDRDEAIRRCAAAFDAAGPDGEAGLIEQLGTPTRTAIALSRGYEPGTIPDVFPAPAVQPEPEPEPAAPEPAEAGELLPPEPEIDWTVLPEPGLPGAGEEQQTSGEAETGQNEVAPAAAPEEKPQAPDEQPDEQPAPTKRKRTAPPEPEPEAEPVYVVERSMPLGLGIPLFILVFVALGIPLAVLSLAVSLVLLLPGAAVLTCAYLAFVGGLWCTGYMADAVLLFGLTFVLLAIGLLVLWAGFWLAVKLLGLYGRAVGWIGGELLGRRVIADE